MAVAGSVRIPIGVRRDAATLHDDEKESCSGNREDSDLGVRRDAATRLLQGHLMGQLVGRHSLRIVLFGDSISEVGRTPNWFGGASAPDRHWGTRLGVMLRKVFPGREFDILPFGIGGQNAYEGLGRVDWLGTLYPDLVLLEFGTNDCGWHPLPPEATALAIGAMIEAIRACYQAEVMVILPVGDNPLCSTMSHVAETRSAIAQAAAARNAPLVDLLPDMLSATKQGEWWGEFHNGKQDCHPSDAGHEIWAHAVFKVLRANLNM